MFRSGGARPPVQEMIMVIEEHRDVSGVGPVCRVLPIAPSTFHARAAIARDPGLASRRAKQDKEDDRAVKRIFDASGKRYGARKVWHALCREGRDIARCTVERLVKAMGLQGVVRGKKVITTNPDTSQPCPNDRVNREFVARRPNQLRVSDFTHVSSPMSRHPCLVTHVSSPMSRHPCLILARNRLRRVRHRCLRPAERRMARVRVNDDRVRTRRPEPGHLPAGAV